MSGHEKNLYQRRLMKEYSVSEADIEARMRWSLPVLSSNSKCSVSLDLPIHNCIPTAVCAQVCYASQGTQLFKRSVIKSLAVQRMIDADPERVARKMVDEGEGRYIRIAGSGEILPSHKTLLDYVTGLNGKWWGFTRRIDTHRVLPQLMFSLDASTTADTLEYVLAEVPIHRRAYLRRPEDAESPISVAVTFPVHGSVTSYAHLVPAHATDCPFDRGDVSGCWRCERCY